MSELLPLIGAAVSIIGGICCFIQAQKNLNYLNNLPNDHEVNFIKKHPKLVENYLKSCETDKKVLGRTGSGFDEGNASDSFEYYPTEKKAACEALNNVIEQEMPRNNLFRKRLENDDFLNNQANSISKWDQKASLERKLGYILIGVGIALTLTAIITKAVDIAKYSSTREENYQRDFTTIPRMIVDKKDIVTTVENEYGELQKKIDFDQYVYYEAVKCNRQDVGRLDVWQNGVENYQKTGCGDAADLNADFAKEWLALYTVKSPRKGAPILADSLNLAYGSGAKPRTDKPSLHLIGYSTPIDVADKAYCYDNRKGSIYFSWQEDKNHSS